MQWLSDGPTWGRGAVAKASPEPGVLDFAPGFGPSLWTIHFAPRFERTLCPLLLAAQNRHVQVLGGAGSEAVMLAMSRGVGLNQEGLALSKKGKFAEAEAAFQESLAIKRKAYAEDSVHICITLSNQIDAQLSWARAVLTGASPAPRGRSGGDILATATQGVKHYLGIARRIGSVEQERIALEIQRDIEATRVEFGLPAASPVPGDSEGVDTEGHTSIVTAGAGGKAAGTTLSVEPPTRRCYGPLCRTPTATTTGLLACGRCRRVYYCSPDCQKAHWKVHKPSCIPPAEPEES